MEDVDAVFRLNQQAFEESWSYQSLYSALDAGYDLLLCESDGELAGYLLSMSMLDEIQIMQIAVAASFRRQGLARDMTRHFIAQNRRMAEISLEVRASNKVARRLYAQLGFTECGCRKSYYSPDEIGRREDAVLMAKLLT
jgi:ribosomal-protein-alanine N-acetyltransferase